MVTRVGEALPSFRRGKPKITGLRERTPVATDVGDFPASLLGSGVIRPGTGSDSTGTSTVITLCTPRPTINPTITNVMSVDGRNWNAFTILDAGGDAMRWARRAFHENQYSYEQIVQLTQSAPAESDQLLFLPYLNGERLGAHQNARAQFFGLTSVTAPRTCTGPSWKGGFRRAKEPSPHERGGASNGWWRAGAAQKRPFG